MDNRQLLQQRFDTARNRLIGSDGRTYESVEPGTLGGNRQGKLYGRLDCPAALRAIDRYGPSPHRVFFADEATAVAAGYRPCWACMREQYKLWKLSQAVPGLAANQ